MGKNLWDGIKNVLVKGVAPILGNAILPGGGGVASSLLANVFGVENTPEAIEPALNNATPEQLAEIKKVEYEHKEELIKLGIEQDRLFLQDIQNARQREIEVVRATGKRDINLYVLAWTVVIGFFGLCGMLIFRTIPQGQNDIVYVLFGGLVTGFSTVLAYFFGSSKGSSDKTKLLAGKADK
jgi:hypothetical protein